MPTNSHVEILAIGSELANGLIQDTNSSYLATEVTRLGGDVRRITILPDDREALLDEFAAAVDRRAAVVIASGGLGPTPDDMTVEVVCEFLGVESGLHEPLLEEFMSRKGVTSRDEVTPNLLKMATVPVGSTIYMNPAGWAPCIEVSRGDTTFFIMPGPPRELQGLFALHLSHLFADRFDTRAVSQRVAVDMHESEVSPHLEAVMAEFPQTYLKAYVALRKGHHERLPVDIVCVGADVDTARSRVEAATNRLRELVEGAGKSINTADA